MTKVTAEGGSLSLVCEVSSLMPARVQWRNPAGEVVNASADRRFTVGANNELTIDPVTAKDRGKWTCEADNLMGSAKLNYDVRAEYGKYDHAKN